MFENIRDNIDAGKYNAKIPWPSKETYPVYPKGHIFDVKQSVEWNAAKNEEYQKRRTYAIFEHRKSEKAAREVFETDIAAAVQNEFKLTMAQGRLIFQYAWDEGHSAGLLEVLQKAQEVAEFVKSVIDAG